MTNHQTDFIKFGIQNLLTFVDPFQVWFKSDKNKGHEDLHAFVYIC